MRRNPHQQPEKPNDPWTDNESPSVVETDEPFVYHVSSKSNPSMPYVVDLSQRGGNGACGCVYFMMVANPAFRRHGKWIPYAPGRQGASECKHIRAAFDHYHQHVTIPMLAKFRNGIEKPD